MSSWDQKSSLFLQKSEKRRNFCVFEQLLKGFFKISKFPKTLLTGNSATQKLTRARILACLSTVFKAQNKNFIFSKKKVCKAILLYKESSIFAKSSLFRSTVSGVEQKWQIHFPLFFVKYVHFDQNPIPLLYTSRFSFVRFLQECKTCLKMKILFSQRCAVFITNTHI